MKKFDLEKYINEFTEVYLSGSIKDVQEKFGLSIGTINTYAKSLGLRKGSQRPTKRKLIFDDLDS